MARSVVRAEPAATDLENAAEYIARDSPPYASAFVQEMIEAGRFLRRFAERGRVVPEFGLPPLPELLVGSYRLIHAVEADRVAIVALVHGRRDLIRLWSEPSGDS